MSNELTTIEQAELEHYEGIIQAGIQTFFEVGNALDTIKTKKLYRQTFSSFEDYCQERWDFGRFRANQLIKAGQVYNNLYTIVNKNAETASKVLPITERQTRPLADLPKEEQPKAWAAAVEAADGKQPTGKQVEATVQKVYGFSKEMQTGSKPAPKSSNGDKPKRATNTSGAGIGRGPAPDADVDQSGDYDDVNQDSSYQRSKPPTLSDALDIIENFVYLVKNGYDESFADTVLPIAEKFLRDAGRR